MIHTRQIVTPFMDVVFVERESLHFALDHRFALYLYLIRIIVARGPMREDTTPRLDISFSFEIERLLFFSRDQSLSPRPKCRDIPRCTRPDERAEERTLVWWAPDACMCMRVPIGAHGLSTLLPLFFKHGRFRNVRHCQPSITLRPSPIFESD